MIAYFDASALARPYVDEEGSELVEAWLAAPMSATSRWTHVEILSAVSRRYREGFLTPEQRNQIAAAVTDDLASFLVVELTPDVIAVADGLLARHALRAGDSIQLASALVLWQRTRQAVAFYGFDMRLGAAAVQEGLVVEGA